MSRMNAAQQKNYNQRAMLLRRILNLQEEIEELKESIRLLTEEARVLPGKTNPLLQKAFDAESGPSLETRRVNSKPLNVMRH